MIDPILELKIRAELLHHDLRDGRPSAVARLRRLSPFRRVAEDALEAAARRVQRRHCLAVIALELGFESWIEAKNVISGAQRASSYGTLLCPRRCGGHLNLWYRNYAHAAEALRVRGGYLLAFRRHFLVVDRPYVEDLGLRPDAPEWRRIGFDWVRPRDVRARTRLYAELISQLPRGGV